MNQAQFRSMLRPTNNGKEYQKITHEDAAELFNKIGCLTRVERRTKRGTTDYLSGGFVKYVDKNLQYMYVTGLMDKKNYCYQIPSCVFYVLPKTDPDEEINHWQEIADNL